MEQNSAHFDGVVSMLDAFYSQLFRPLDYRPSEQTSLLIAGLVLVIMSLNAAGALHAGPTGMLLFLFLFCLGGAVGFFWLSAAVILLASLFGGTSQSRAVLYALMGALWPLMFSGAVIAFQRWDVNLAALLSMVMVLGTLASLVHTIHRVYDLDIGVSFTCLFLSLGLTVISIFGLLVWPLMLFLGL